MSNSYPNQVLKLLEQFKETHAEQCFDCKAVHLAQDASYTNATLAAIIEAVPDFVALVDTQARLLLANTLYQNYFLSQYGQPLRYGVSMFEQIADSSRSVYWKPYYQKALQGEVFSVVDEVFLVDGEQRTFEVRFMPVRNEEREVLGCSIVIRDLTELIASRQSLQNKQDLLASISQNIKEGIYRSSPEHGVFYANQTFLEMFGYESLDDLREYSPQGLYFLPEERAKIVQKLVKDVTFSNLEVHFRRKDGSHFWGELSGMTSTDKQGNVWFDGAVRDITQRKEADELLRLQNDELKKVNEELDRFVYSASHDLRAPLMSILGIVELMKIEKQSENQDLYIEMIEKSVKKLDMLTREITHYSRNSRLEVVPEKINVRKLVQDIFDELAYLPNSPYIEKSIELHSTLEEALVDANRLHKIIANLVSNAINYHDLLGEKPFIKVSLRIDAQQVQISVADNGKGIHEDYQGKIFDMFCRLTNDGQGSGLGLYIVKEMVQKMNGRIELISQPRVGTTFHVWLPLQNQLP
jgi:PAS domain S-box-containing protein